MSLSIIILAAGRGTRMKSSQPKVLHPIAGKPMLRWIIDTAQALQPKQLYPIIGYQAQQLRGEFADAEVCWVEQTEQLGTGHAVQQVLPHLDDKQQVLVLVGDTPLISTNTLRGLISITPPDGVGLLTANVAVPTGLGRILRDPQGRITQIVEEKDASAEQGLIKEINTGVYVLPSAGLKRWLPQLTKNNQQGELYLTDVIAMAVAEGQTIHSARPTVEQEIWSVNDRVQLAKLERYQQMRTAEQLMRQGVTLHDPQRLDIRGDVSVGQDTEIDINVVLQGKVSIGSNVKIGANVVLTDVTIADNVVIKSHCDIEQATIASNCQIGPFARIRPGSEFANGVKIGNFVETKKAVIGAGSKVNHLSYVGDAKLGAGVNIGAGTITCNYDGVNKHQTVIENNAFVGANNTLVAPVVIGEGATVAAGSTISKAAPAAELTVARAKQVTLKGWKRPTK